MVPDLRGRLNSARNPGLATLLLVWTLVGTLSYARYAIEAGSGLQNLGRAAEDLIEWLTCFYPWLLLTPFLIRLERRFHLFGPNWKSSTGVFAMLSFPLTWLAYDATILMDACVRFAFHSSPLITRAWWPMPVSELVLEQAILWPTLGACGVLRRLSELRDKDRLAARLEVEKSQIEASLRRSELELLRLRLNPHFLFNSLQNISTLARQDPDAASRMLARLGEVLRAALHKDAQSQTTLSAEIELTKAYVAVEQIRFAGRLSVLYEIDPVTEQALVPSFLLQPLVENAMTHGLKGSGFDGAIWIRSSAESDRLVLTVSDNGAGPPAERLANLELGIGLSSTCERLERLYPARHAFSMRNLPEGGTEVRITLPFQSGPSFQENSDELDSIAHRR